MAPRTGHHKTPRPDQNGESKKKQKHAREKTDNTRAAVQKPHASHRPRAKQMNGPRGGREAVTVRILDAAEQLFASQGVAGTSMRDVATAAGVSHALAHRYVGSKSDLLATVFRRRQLVLAEAIGFTDDLDEGVIAAMSLPEPIRRHMRLMARAAVEGIPYPSTAQGFPAARKLLELAERRAVGSAEADEGVADEYLDPRLVVAGLIVLALGWQAIEPWVVGATNLDSWSREELDAGLLNLMLRIAAAPMASDRADQAEGVGARSVTHDDDEEARA